MKEAKQDFKHLKTKSMENNNIKVHPPWYARGTPVTKPRDGPAVANGAMPLFAARNGPPARGEPPDKTSPWPDLKTTFFNMQNRMYSQWYAQIRQLADDKNVADEVCITNQPQRGAKIIADEIHIAIQPRRGVKIKEMANTAQPKPRRGVRIIEMLHVPKPRRGAMIIADEIHITNQPRRGVKIIAMYMLHVPKPRRGAMIIADEIHITNQPRRGARIIATDMTCASKPRRGIKIIAMKLMVQPKTRRVERIIGRNDEQQKYHPSGVSFPHHDLCYNPTIPFGIENRIHPSVDEMNIVKNQPRRGAMIIADEIHITNQPRRGVKIIATDMTCASKPRRGAMIIAMKLMAQPKTRRVDRIIDRNDEQQKYHPSGVSVPHHDLCYNPTIPIGIENRIHPSVDEMNIASEIKIVKNQPRRGAMIIAMKLMAQPKTQRVDRIIDRNDEHQKYHPSGVSVQHRDLCYNPTIPIGIENRIHPSVDEMNIASEIKIVKNQPRRGAMIIAMKLMVQPKTRRVERIIGRNDEQQKYHPSGVSVPHRDLCYNPTIPIGIENRIHPSVDEMNIASEIKIVKNQPRRGVKIIAMKLMAQPKTRRVDKIIDKNDERLKYHPSGVSVQHRDLCYNPTIPIGIENRIHPFVDEMNIASEIKIVKNQPRRGIKIIAMKMMMQLKTRRVDRIIDINDEQQKYHPSGVSFPHHDLCYNPTIRQKRIENQNRWGNLKTY